MDLVYVGDGMSTTGTAGLTTIRLLFDGHSTAIPLPFDDCCKLNMSVFLVGRRMIVARSNCSGTRVES